MTAPKERDAGLRRAGTGKIMTNQGKLIGAAVLVAVGTVATWAVAGQTYFANVAVDPVARTASGTFVTARKSANAQEAIQCNVKGFSSGAVSAECWAKDPEGDYLICTSSNEAFVKALGAIVSYGSMSFTANSAGACTAITVNNGSRFLP